MATFVLGELNMKNVVLVGTAHTYQLPLIGKHTAGIEKFRDTIRTLCSAHKVGAIAEEMDKTVLEEKGVLESVAQQVCSDLGLRHQFSDPSLKERKELGIRTDEEIRHEGWLNGWSQATIDSMVLSYGTQSSDRVREQEWLRRIKALDIWPLLFICGANHFVPLRKLLHEAGMTVTEAHQDWES